jgi:hypothetical protein
MEPREALALEQLDAAALLREQRGHGRARGSASYDDDIAGVIGGHQV